MGLAFAALIYVVCFSGSIAVFTYEFTRWEQPERPVLHAVSPAAADAAFRAEVLGKLKELARNPAVATASQIAA